MVTARRPQSWILVTKLAPRLRQAHARKLAAQWSHSEGATVSKVINCECGQTVRAENDDELVEKVERHVSEAHPELIGKMSRQDVLAMAEEA
jgi:predicted small metal-binding protein